MIQRFQNAKPLLQYPSIHQICQQKIVSPAIGHPEPWHHQSSGQQNLPRQRDMWESKIATPMWSHLVSHFFLTCIALKSQVLRLEFDIFLTPEIYSSVDLVQPLRCASLQTFQLWFSECKIHVKGRIPLEKCSDFVLLRRGKFANSASVVTKCARHLSGIQLAIVEFPCQACNEPKSKIPSSNFQSPKHYPSNSQSSPFPE